MEFEWEITMPQDPLPTEIQRRRLCEMIQLAFVEIRRLGWAGKAQQAGDLAEAFHNISREMYGWGTFSWGRFMRDLSNYQRAYSDADPGYVPFNFTARLRKIMQDVEV